MIPGRELGLGKTGQDSAKGPGRRFGLYYWLSIANVMATDVLVTWFGYLHPVLSALLPIGRAVSSH